MTLLFGMGPMVMPTVRPYIGMLTLLLNMAAVTSPIPASVTLRGR